MRDYLDADDAARTQLLKDLAKVLVDAREHFYTKDGAPDWAGRTYPYRMWVREAYTEANVPPSQRTTIQAATRWHVGAALRERAPAEELEAAGLDPKSPRERNVDARAERATARSLVGPGPVISDADDLVAVADIFEVTLRRIPAGATASMRAKDRARVEQAWTPIWERLNAAAGPFIDRRV